MNVSQQFLWFLPYIFPTYWQVNHEQDHRCLCYACLRGTFARDNGLPDYKNICYLKAAQEMPPCNPFFPKERR